VEVDDETGAVQVLKIVSAYDVGRAINPDMVRTQMEGGAVQGMSTALLEGLIFDNRGVPRNPNFTDYRIATSADAPLETENTIVEVPQDDDPFGARGVGEHPMAPTAPAIANAVLSCGRGARGQHADHEREGVGGAFGCASLVESLQTTCPQH
jgi:CO/xanthine dehydrogenase Mo-binding subunit